LKNQLLQAGRVVSDSFSKLEVEHVKKARSIIYSIGLAEALVAGERETVAALAKPAASVAVIENLILIDANQQESLHIILQSDRSYKDINAPTGVGELEIVARLLLQNNPEALPRRVFAQSPVDNRYYYYTFMPIPLDGQVVGVVVIGTSFETILSLLKNTSLADVIIYTEGGQAIASTLTGQVNTAEDVKQFSISSAEYLKIINASDIVYGENVKLNERDYSIARNALRIADDRLGAFAVVLPTQFVIESGSASRNIYIILFTLVTLGVVVIGFRISRLIVNPLNALLHASQAIADGNLQHRTGIRTGDEIGELASNFDEMTERLQERTEELRKTYEVLKQMDRTKVSFIEVAAHELRTPLTLVKGYSQMLAMKFRDDPEVLALTQGVEDGTERMTEIVGSMLDVSRIDSKLLKILPEDMHLGVVIGRVFKTFREAFQERRIAINIQGIDGLPVIQADPDQLYKVFYHLVMNAIKYTPDGGRVSINGNLVAGKDQQHELEIVVSDTGIGIDPEHHELIFEKFYQTGEVYMHSSGKTKFKGGGPGLGLAIARGIIEAHHGRIWVESLGHDETNLPGSKFFVRLPLEERNESTQQPAA